jgi:hypothetical protein
MKSIIAQATAENIAKRQAAEPEFPMPVITWDTLRAGIAQVKSIGKTYLMGQCWLGWQLSTLKKQHGVREGRPSKNSANLAEFRTWSELVRDETGLSDRTADRFIKLFEATLAKLKRTKGALIGKAALLAFEREDPLTVLQDDANELREIIASLCDGETQGSLMQELGIVPKVTIPTNPGGERKKLDCTAGQLAFFFFETIAAPMTSARMNPDYKMMLLSLPMHPTEEIPVSLVTLEAETRAMLADIEEAKATHAKAARGRTL